MTSGRVFAFWLLCLGVLFLAAGYGCRHSAPPAVPPSQAVVESYCQALVRKEWTRAYGLLDAESQKRCSRQRFVQLGPLEIDKFGFVPESCHVHSCQQREATAIAQLVFYSSPAKNRRYRDSLTLRQSGGEWKIELPENFGVKRR
jgi:hypothetical protein